ncbi:glutenin, high molecular weight subunit PW212-like isoform X2 [Mizuhopecten yessoensis]|uniref:glutenin, high molecular weight subunit PW212-like isoform X2 n=1 Tax=Mizuhopecten yessoensis TaxID=6573 RepID=UPI000B45CB68|nr:glutenin, high molecular weight subunit PW212-like isoform X2 [Mizuhopecten yessoensis]
MMYVKCLCLILSVYIVHVSSHENAYPPGIPPPNSQQQAHQHQAQQGYPNQGQQGNPNQGQQGHLNQGQQGNPNQGQQGQLNQGQQGNLNQGQQGHLNQGQQGNLNQGQQGQQGENLQFQAGQQQQQNLEATGHYQDVNVQNMQQGGPTGGGGRHGHHQGGFRQKEQVHNLDHIKEHLKEVIDKPKEDMTEEELEFHYFKLHDYDANNKLDGTEITKAITHFHDDHENANATPEEQAANKKVFSDEELSNIVEMVLKEDDLDKDGYITYAEFVKAQRKAQVTEPTQT